MRIAVCDDEKNQNDLIIEYARNWAEKHDEMVEVYAYSSAIELLYYWSEGKSFDVVFLDINMKNMNGVELARILRKNGDMINIVFITGLKDYVFQGYEVQALDYLLKPVKKERCLLCLDRALEILSLRSKETFIITLEKESLRLRYNEIYAFEILSHYVGVKTTKGNYTFKKKISELEQELPSDKFFRCHRSFIVNMHYVNTVKKTELLLDNGIYIPVSKSRWDGINKTFLNYYTKGMKL